jgi:hypothetical protein
MARNRSDAFRIANDVRQEFRQRPQVLYTQTEYQAALDARLADEDFAPLFRQAFVSQLAEQVDRSSRRRAPDAQLSLPGLGACDLGGDMHLGGGRRVARRRARVEHGREELELERQNRDAVNDAYKQARKLFNGLLPYWKAGVSLEEAALAYRADHQSEAS